MSIEQKINEVNRRGLWVNNLWQLDVDYWRCDLGHNDHTFRNFGAGKTPEEALDCALLITDKPPEPAAEDTFEDLI